MNEPDKPQKPTPKPKPESKEPTSAQGQKKPRPQPIITDYASLWFGRRSYVIGKTSDAYEYAVCWVFYPSAIAVCATDQRQRVRLKTSDPVWTLDSAGSKKLILPSTHTP